MKDPVPRRSFLRLLALAAGGIACSRLGALISPTASSIPQGGASPTPFLPVTPEPSFTALPPTQTPRPIPDLVVARGGEPEEMVRRALSALGGMERFVKPGADLILKPNICVAYRSYEYAATTNPWVVGALVRLALEAGASRVRVMDFPFGGEPAEAYVRSGIQQEVLAAGGELEIMRHLKFVSTSLPGAKDLRTCAIYDEILKADLVINVPIAKHHSLASLTLGMKNLMGVILDRPQMHSNLGQRLADLASRVRPALTIVAAIRVFAQDL